MTADKFFTKDSGEIVNRAYIRARAMAALRRSSRNLSLPEREAVLIRTVDNDAWLTPRNGYLVSAICREVSEIAFLSPR